MFLYHVMLVMMNQNTFKNPYSKVTSGYSFAVVMLRHVVYACMYLYV